MIVSEKQNSDRSSLVKIDSLLYVDTSAVEEYPYSEWYKSHEIKEQKIADSVKTILESNPNIIIDYFPPKPKIFIVENYNDTIAAKDYCKRFSAKHKTRGLIFFNIKMEWNGKISEVRLDRVKGELPTKLDLIDLAKKLRG